MVYTFNAYTRIHAKIADQWAILDEEYMGYDPYNHTGSRI